MTPEESLQHEWIKEGLVSKRKEQHKHKHHGTTGTEPHADPYKVPAQPVKGEQKELPHGKTNNLHRRKQSCRSASQ